MRLDPGRFRNGKPAFSAVPVLVLLLLATSCTDTNSDANGAGSEGDEGGLELQVVSSRPDMVSGGDALLSVNASEVDSVSVDGERTEVDFESRSGSGDPGEERTGSIGLVEGLPEGRSTITVEADGGSAEVEVVNHPRNGPVFSGDRLPMVTCTTDRYGMAPGEPPECDAEAVVRFAHIDADGALEFIEGADPSASEPPDGAATVEIDGSEQPALVRVESVVIDRGVATIVTLANASRPGAGLADSWDLAHWNRRLVYRFGGGCGTTYSQGFNFFDAPSTELLADGYAFATNTLDTFQVQCQDIISAEAAMMTKEYFAERYGLPHITIGEGGSGGAIQQFLIAQNYPGILDAITPSSPFPDAMSIAPGVIDCALLANYYSSEQGSALSTQQRRAINGHLSGLTCVMWDQTFVPVADPSRCGFGDAAGAVVDSLPGLAGGLPTVPDSEAYDPDTNPGGLRCTMQDSYPQIFDEDPETGFAERPVDNIGVQYGLDALNSGVIDVEEFLDLNEHVGGMDIDANFVRQRMEADPDTVEKVYETGRITARGPLAQIPIIVTNTYTDPEGDIHDRFRMFSMEQRLAADDGTRAPGYVMWTRPSPPEGSLTDQLAGAADAGASAIRVADEWATALRVDGSDEPIERRLADTRPDGAVDTCFDLEGQVVEAGEDVYRGPGPCTDPYPMGGDPRTTAGAPLANDIVKCALQPVDDAVRSGVYGVELTAAQIERLESVFPDGVCDWSVPGVGQVPVGEPWQRFD